MLDLFGKRRKKSKSKRKDPSRNPKRQIRKGRGKGQRKTHRRASCSTAKCAAASATPSLSIRRASASRGVGRRNHPLGGKGKGHNGLSARRRRAHRKGDARPARGRTPSHLLAWICSGAGERVEGGEGKELERRAVVVSGNGDRRRPPMAGRNPNPSAAMGGQKATGER